MNVIFLDIDGVLTNHNTRYSYPDTECVHWLNWLIFITGAQIVISSSRRNDQDIIEWLLKYGVEGRIIGITPTLAKYDAESDLWIASIRGDEIAEWVKIHKPDHFVILDDDDDMGALSGRLIRTDTQVGLTQQKALDAANLMER